MQVACSFWMGWTHEELMRRAPIRPGDRSGLRGEDRVKAFVGRLDVAVEAPVLPVLRTFLSEPVSSRVPSIGNTRQLPWLMGMRTEMSIERDSHPSNMEQKKNRMSQEALGPT